MKRILAVFLCLCLLLTGCNSKKENGQANQNTNENGTSQTYGKEIDDNQPETDRGDSAIADLLTLNKAWALVKTVELDQPEFTLPDYDAQVKSYRIEDDLSNIENINQFSGFTKKQIAMLVKNGFVVLPSNDSRIFYVYDDNEYKGVPNFVTSDAVLHLYHQFYDKSLMSIEADYLYQDLDLMTKQMLDKSIRMLEMLTDEDLKALQKKNIVYFLVARMLFLESEATGVSVDSDLLRLAKQEYELASEAQSRQLSPLFGVDVDYTQFTVRGHYTRSEELGRYFRTMMWFGTAPLALVDENKEVIYDNVYQALLMTYTTIANSEETCDAQLWTNIYQPTAQYVGLSDDVNVFTMNGLRMEVFGNDENPDIYNDEEFHSMLTKKVQELPQPQIQGEMLKSSIPTGKQFRFMGQRYILDSEILQKLMKPIDRPVPAALDVMGVFGSKTAKDLIFNVYKPQDSWPDYTQIFQELYQKVSDFDEDYWKTNLYTGWLWSIQEILTEYGINSGMPFFMTNDAWKNKSLNTALGSYTELKHDSVLYGKQPMAEMGGPLEYAKLHYVEPDVGLYGKLLYLTDFTCSVLEEKGMLGDSLKNGAERYKELLKLLLECSIKELRNEPLTEEENDQLLHFGGTIENICINFQMGVDLEDMERDPTDMLATDIATCDESYLTIATGYFDHIYVVVPYDGKLYLSRGGVYSTYELLSDKRLTDEDWWALQGITIVRGDWGDYAQYGESSADLPKQAGWIYNFKSDSNNVTIKELEVLWDYLEE